MENPIKYCPNCPNELIQLTSGKLLCRNCGWTSQPDTKATQNKATTFNKTEEKETPLKNQTAFAVRASLFPRLILLLSGIYLIVSGMEATSIRAESEGVFSTSLVAEQIRTEGRLHIGLGFAISAFSFCLNINATIKK